MEQVAKNDGRRAAEMARLSRLPGHLVPAEIRSVSQHWGADFALEAALAMPRGPAHRLREGIRNARTSWASVQLCPVRIASCDDQAIPRQRFSWLEGIRLYYALLAAGMVVLALIVVVVIVVVVLTLPPKTAPVRVRPSAEASTWLDEAFRYARPEQRGRYR